MTNTSPTRSLAAHICEAAPATTTPTATPAKRHDGWTVQRQSVFLRELAASHSVKQAARAAGMSRQSAYALRARLKGEPFDLAWNAALRCRFDALAEEAMDRAMNGVEVPHFYRGELVGTSRRYDERLTVALLAMRESFRPRQHSRSHPSSDYAPDEFGNLLSRVETGPETWLEERYANAEAYADEDCASLGWGDVEDSDETCEDGDLA
ncbi:hypothetical protein [Aurantiacibacter gangjinensis]|uniref:hypothetical protein n=1 Tax=Aurantiacibacter gangjinensis TaxID=502682 RepID=UPI00069B3DA8|nr:hypothetical protein [Aurantiacibacter gangjinensis]APE27984.1 hypothetical protein BMF35_a1155 [Aurantiacibacter gangjinensis]